MNKINPDKNRRVLIIDDNRTIHDDFRKILSPIKSVHPVFDATGTALFGEAGSKEEQIPFDLDSAYQGQEGAIAVRKALGEGRPYAMAFVDVRMPPGWDGVETVQEIWKIDPDIQIVMCTAYSDYSWDEMFEKIGHSDALVILKKPFDIVEALQLAHALTEKWWLHRLSREKMEKLESMVAIRTNQFQQSNHTLQVEVLQHKRAEEELRWKTAFLEAQVNSSSDGILVVDQQGNKTLLNQRFIDLFRMPEHIADEILDENRLRWVTDMVKNPEKFVEKVTYLYSHPNEISRDEIELKNGAFLDRYSSPVIGKDGKYYGRIWTFRDITGRKQDEEALRESEERFSGAFEHAPIGVALVSPEGRWMKVNRILCEMLGYSEIELLDCSFQDITHPDDLEFCLESVRQMVNGEAQTCQSEKRYIHRDGHFVQVSFNLSLVRDEKSQPRYLIAQIQDITERKRAQTELEEEKARLVAAQAVAKVGSWETDFATLGVNWSEETYRIFETSPDKHQPSHQGFLECVHPDDRAAVEEAFGRSIGQTGTQMIEHRLRMPDGRVKFVEERWQSLSDDHGRPLRAIGTCHDVTERKQAELELRFNEQRYRSLVEAAAAIVWDTPASGEFEVDQPDWSTFTGQSFEELRGWGWLDAVHPDDRAETVRVWKHSLENRSAYEVEHRLRAGDGTYHNMAVRAVPILADDGTVRQWFGVHSDITDRKRAEEALFESKRFAESIAENSTSIIYVFDLETNRTVYSNRNAAEKLGYSKAQIFEMGEALLPTIIHPEDFPRIKKSLARFGQVADGEIIDLEYRVKHANGGIHWMWARESVFKRRPDGTVWQIMGTAQDVTERRKIEEALHRQQTELRVLFDLMPVMIWFKDTEDRILHVNKTAAQTTSRSVEEIEGRQAVEIYPSYAARFYEGDLEVIHSGKPKLGLIETICDRQGEELWIQTDRVPVCNKEGIVVGVVVMVQDITLRKRAEEELFQSREKLRGILDHIPQRVFWKDRTLTFLGCNRAFAEDLGFNDPSDVIGKTDLEMNSKTLAELYQADDQSVIELDAAKFNIEEPGRDADGNLRWLRTSKVPLHDQHGRVSGILGTYEDVTEAKLAKQEIQKLEAHLVQSQKLETVGKLAGGIAHEFNSILTAIIGQSELLLNDLPSGSSMVNNVTEISKAAGRAATLTRQLLAYGRKQLLRPVILDLNGVLVGMKDVLHHLMGAGMEIQIIPAFDLKAVRADMGQIEQVILNMAINANDAMPNGGKLTLETANVSFPEQAAGSVPELKAGDYVMLAITDTGMGMTVEIKDRVFEPFFTTKGVGEGTGLGLSTCYGIIKQSGGSIRVYSEPGRGSCFKIYLPKVENEKVIPVESLSSLDLPLGSETILLVENDPALREIATVLLRRLGYTVLPAANGIEALSLKQLRDIGHIDLLFTDVVTTHMSGKELADRVRLAYPGTRVLFTSAYTENSILQQGVLNKGVTFLQKPFTPSALAKRLREVLDSPDLLDTEA